MKAFKYSLLVFVLIGAFTTLVSAQDSAGNGGGASASQSSGESGGSSSFGGGGSGIGMVVGENYVLKPSDIVQIQVYKEKDLDKTVRIEGDGTISLALIGKVKVSNMTVGEAQSLVTDLYNRDYLVDPQISLLVVNFSPKIVRILGSVNRPGVVQIPPDRDLTLTEAIAGVNGISRLGNPRAITIKRVEGDGRPRQMEVNFSRILTEPDTKDVLLKEGDVIWVPERLI